MVENVNKLFKSMINDIIKVFPEYTKRLISQYKEALNGNDDHNSNSDDDNDDNDDSDNDGDIHDDGIDDDDNDTGDNDNSKKNPSTTDGTTGDDSKKKDCINLQAIVLIDGYEEKKDLDYVYSYHDLIAKGKEINARQIC